MNHLKTMYSLFLALLCITCASAMSIQDAFKQNLISVDIQTNETGTHYSEPFVMKVRNLTSTKLDLELDNGYLLEPMNEEEQTMIVTNRLLASLSPRETKDLFVNAMCIEQRDAAPDEDSRYTFADLATPELRKLSGFIEENKHFEPNAQFLIWGIANGSYPKEFIHAFKIDEFGQVQILNKENEILNPVFSNNIPDTLEQINVHGSFEMNLSRPKNVHIAMFNENNVIVKELFKNPQTPAGKTELEYEFNSLEYEEDVYFVKLVVDGKVLISRKIAMDFYWDDF